jgi:predicted flavoprotein YhiN
LDVDGGCGGFNLQWAWSSGLLAGELGDLKHNGMEEQLYV